MIRFDLALAWSGVFISRLALLAMAPVDAQQIDQATIIQGIDNAVRARVNSIAGYTVTENYAVFRGKDQTHSVAGMTVKRLTANEGARATTSSPRAGLR